MKKEYLRRLRLVSGPKLSVKNKIQATGSLAVAALRGRIYKIGGTLVCRQQGRSSNTNC
jgi:hypothetical protein